MVSHYQGFGGVGDSGYGRYGGYEGFKHFSNRKGQFYKAPMPAGVRQMTSSPFTDDKLRLVKRVFMFASLHNQQEVYWWLRAIVTSIAVLVILYYFYL